jgi:perosamine synthetase
MTPPRGRIPVAHPVLSGNERKYVDECIDTAWISSVGRFISAFETEFARYIETPHALACCNGTVALHLALLGIGCGPGDEVIVPTLTYIASANAVTYCGATPVFVDVDPRTFNLDPVQVESRITPRTKAIMAVHLYGHPADMDPLIELAARHRLALIEDAAESHGALYKGRKTGSIGEVGVFSFFGNKILTTGEGGMVTTANAELAKRMKLLRGQGMDLERRYWFPIVGYNYRMTNIEAAIGLAQLERVEDHLTARKRVRGWYDERLRDLTEFVQMPIEEPWASHSFWMYTIVLSDAVVAGITRDAFMAGLDADGIETRPVFYPMHVLPPYLDRTRRYPVADRLAAQGVNLPTHGKLTEDDVDYIVSRIRASLRQASVALPRHA